MAPLVAGCRAALVGVGCDQARIDRETVAADEISLDAGSDDALEHLAENIVLAEALVAGAREGGVIGNLVLDAETAEPAVGEVELHFAAERAFRADREHVADDEHPDHQFRIDRGPAGVRIVRREFVAQPGEVQNRRDPPRPDGRPAPPHRDRTHRTAVPVQTCTAPSSNRSVDGRLNRRNHASPSLSS